MSNGAYLQSKEGLEARRQEITKLNEQFDEAIDGITNPEADEDPRSIPVVEAGMRGLERLQWDYFNGPPGAQLEAQGL